MPNKEAEEMDEQELRRIIESHGKWLRGEEDGERAALRVADLRGADLCGADLRGADLYGANLNGATLYGADLNGANLYGADLPEKIMQVGPIGSRNAYMLYWVDRNIVQCGCWRCDKGGSLAEFKKRIDEVYPADKLATLRYRREYLAAIAMFEMFRR